MSSELRRGEWRGKKKREAALRDKGFKARGRGKLGLGSGLRGASSQAGRRLTDCAVSQSGDPLSPSRGPGRWRQRKTAEPEWKRARRDPQRCKKIQDLQLLPGMQWSFLLFCPGDPEHSTPATGPSPRVGSVAQQGLTLSAFLASARLVGSPGLPTYVTVSPAKPTASKLLGPPPTLKDQTCAPGSTLHINLSSQQPTLKPVWR